MFAVYTLVSEECEKADGRWWTGFGWMLRVGIGGNAGLLGIPSHRGGWRPLVDKYTQGRGLHATLTTGVYANGLYGVW